MTYGVAFKRLMAIGLVFKEGAGGTMEEKKVTKEPGRGVDCQGLSNEGVEEAGEGRKGTKEHKLRKVFPKRALEGRWGRKK